MRLSKARLNRGATEGLNSKRAVQFFFFENFGKIRDKCGENTGARKKMTFF